MVISVKFFFTITKKGLIIALASVSLLLLTSIWTFSIKADMPDGSTHAKRMVYAKSLNLSLDEEKITSKETVIPTEFGAVYSEYNEIQKQAGFNLKNYKGKTVTVYSCPLTDKKRTLTLIVCNGKIIGGDIAEISANGKMLPLKEK